ncbi:MAG: sugar ABC transporter substrate-binding protein, partial [Mesorhizobium sp.]
QDPAGEGKAAVEALGKLKKGEKIDPIINIPVTIVTKKNVDQYRAMFK